MIRAWSRSTSPSAVATGTVYLWAYLVIPDSDGTTGNGTDYTTRVQAALDYAGTLGPGTRIVFPNAIGKHIRVTSTLEIPDATTFGVNSAIDGGYYISGAGMSGSGVFFDADTGFALQSKSFSSAGPRLGVYIHDLHVFGKAYTTASGGIRLRNPRSGGIERCFIHSFPFGDAIQIYANGTGGAFYARIRDNKLGWWHLGDDAFPVLGVYDKWWLNRGVVLIGNEDGSGKADEITVDGNAIWNCKSVYIACTGLDTDGNPGVPNPAQNGVLGGAAYNRITGNSFYGGQSARILTGTLASATSTTVVLPSDAVQTDDYYNGLKIWISSGTGIGQVAKISDYVGSTRTATVAGTWDTTPDNTSDFKIGHYAAGILYDSAGGVFCMSTYSENVPNPVRITANADNHFEWFGANIKNTGTGIYFDVPTALSGTAAAGGASSITLEAGTFSTLDDAYEDRIIEITGGTGTVGERRKITASDGTTGECDVAVAWSVAPDNTTTYTILPGTEPSLLLGGGNPRYTYNRPAGMQLPPTGLQVGSSSISDATGFWSVWANYTGAALTPGTVVRQATDGGKKLAANSTANVDCPLVVVGIDGSSYPDGGGETMIARSGAECSVLVDTTVNETDTIVASSTAGQATVNNSQTDPKKIIGYATTTDSGGSCKVRIL